MSGVNSNGGDGGEKRERWFKPKEGSVFPIKKSVKEQMGKVMMDLGKELVDSIEKSKNKKKTFPGDDHGGDSA